MLPPNQHASTPGGISIPTPGGLQPRSHNNQNTIARGQAPFRFGWTEGDEAKSAEATVTGVGENRVSCGFPQALAQTAVGTEINVTVVKTVDGADYTATCRQTTTLAADPS